MKTCCSVKWEVCFQTFELLSNILALLVWCFGLNHYIYLTSTSLALLLLSFITMVHFILTHLDIPTFALFLEDSTVANHACISSISTWWNLPILIPLMQKEKKRDKKTVLFILWASFLKILNMGCLFYGLIKHFTFSLKCYRRER